MNKAEKTALVEDLSNSFGRASIALVSEYRGMTAAESTEMRKRLRAVRGEMRVAKNTLVRRAIKGTAYEALDEEVMSQQAPIAPLFNPRWYDFVSKRLGGYVFQDGSIDYDTLYIK